MVANDERFDKAVDRFSRTGIAGAVLGVPVLLLVALDAPQWLSIGYVLVMAVALALMIVRGHNRS